jgi:hypothetical protein
MKLLSDREILYIANSHMEHFCENHEKTRAMPEYEVVDFVDEIEAEVIKKIKMFLGVYDEM